MKKLIIKYRYLASIILIFVASIVVMQTTDNVGGVKIANANQVLQASSLTNPGDEPELAAFSPDGNILASVDSDGQIVLSDVASGQTRSRLRGLSAGLVSSIVFSPDGNTLASVSDKDVYLWDVLSGKPRSILPDNTVVTDLEFSPDSKTLAAVNLNSRITLWSSESGSITQTLNADQTKVNTLAFSPDSRILAAGTQDAEIKLWDTATGIERGSLRGVFGSAVTDLVFSPDGKTLAALGQDSRITLWDPQSETSSHVLSGHLSGVNYITFSPNSKFLASGGQDAQIKLWNSATGLEQLNLHVQGAVTGLVFSQDGKALASIGESNSVFLWDLSNKHSKLLTGHLDWINKIIFSDHQKTLASVGKTGQVVVWNLKTGLEKLAFQISLSDTTIASAQGIVSGNTLTNKANAVTASSALSVGNQISAKATAVNQNSASENKKIRNHDWKGITTLAVSPDGKLYGGATQDGTVRLWTSSGKQNFTVSEHHGAAVTGVVFTADGKRLVSVGKDSEIQIRNITDGKKTQSLLAHEQPIRAVAASSDGKYIASAGEETRVMLWDAKTNKLIKILSGHTSFVNAVSFSANGTQLASAGADGRILVWDVKTGQLINTLLGHSKEINAIAFSKDGKLLASAGADSLVVLWDAATGQQIQSFSGHSSAIRAISFSPDGQKLVSAGEDNKILVWNMMSRKLDKQVTGSVNVINSLVFTPMGKIISGNESGEVAEWNIETNQIKQLINIPLQPQSNNSQSIPDLNAIGSGFDNTVTAAVTTKFSNVFIRVLEWIIPSAEAAIPPPPGGPILIVTTTSDPFGQYYAEILRTEGFNEFASADISTITPAILTNYDVVILASMPLTNAQTTLFTNWVNGDSTNPGGNLIAIKPDPKLASLLGLAAAGGIAPANGYLLVDTGRTPGNGIIDQTIQFHSSADLYSLSGASSIATLYSNSTSAMLNPAVTLRSVGAFGGQAASFAYDIARSIVYTRQGNPAWATQERDGFVPKRSDDKFYGNATGGNAVNDPQLDWVDLTKVAIPQADEQQRLLANLITQMNLSKKPLPRFWYFPNGKKAVVIMTGDDHGNGGTGPRFDQFKALSPANCNVAKWECIRGTSYIFVEPGNLSDAQAAAYTAEGFEVSLHINTNVKDYTPASLEGFYASQLSDFNLNYPSIPAPITERHHATVWSDWITAAQTELNHGIRLDTSYYFWPPSWVGNQPGNFTGSAMPMRFVDLSGNIVDVFQAASQMSDESGQVFPLTIDTLLDRALGAEGYYGAYTINAHTDLPQTAEASAVVASAQARNVPVVSSVQMLNWLDARNSSSFSNLSWNGSTTLNFAIIPNAAAIDLQAMLPTHSSSGLALTALNLAGSNVSYTIDTIKGIEYAFFPAAAGAYTATYGVDTTKPTVLASSPANAAPGINPLNKVTATFSKAMNVATINSVSFELRDANNTLVSTTVTYSGGNQTATLTPSAPLAAQSTYTAKVKGGVVADLAGNTLATDYIWSFTTGSLSNSNSAWSGSAVPANLSANDPGPVELGVKFKVDSNGFISGMSFYKGAGNTGTHIGNLWDASGNKLATATFANETALGWQQVNFSSPVAVTPGNVYVASYFAPSGHYAYDYSFFANAGVDNMNLHLLQNGVSGGNGVYVYGASSAFPSSSYQSSNYWVDVLFTPATTGLEVVSTTPANGQTGVSPGMDSSQVPVNISFNNTLNPASITGSTFTLKDANNVVLPASVSVTVNTATLDTASALKPSSTYTATITTGVKDINGNSLLSNYSWSFTTGATPANCSSPPNPIVAENCMAGNPSTEWEVSGGTDASGDPTIQGFATDISINQGATINFKINTPVNIPYRLDIYRMGYYSGNGARKIDTVNPVPASQAQPACLNNSATGLIDCGNWAVSASWSVPANAASGIYFARAVRTDTGGASHIVFIVRNDASTSNILFQTSDTTWHAYNDYGGKNLYTGSPGTNPARAYKVSYNRPFHTRVYEPESWVFNAEYPMVRWLEANGYDVSYFSGVDTERNAALIKSHKVWMSNGHDEYWSATQRASVQAARDAGVNLAFFSANTMFWKTRWENAIDGSGTPYRTLVCYKETHANAKIDPLDPPTWTGTWRDPRFSPPADGGQPENALVGTIFRMNAPQNSTITVPQADGQMRFWRNTSVATLAAGQVATLAPGTVGAEVDDDEDNGFRPAGLFELSNTPITDQSNYLLDYGSTYGAGTINHKSMLYKAPSGAWVFAAGTYQWSWGLDANHDRSSLGSTTDVRMQQATVNLLADMGVQPTTLQGGIVIAAASTDGITPVSTITAPTAGSTVTQGSSVTVSGTATDTGGGVIGGVEISVDGGITWHPATGRANWSYTWTPSLIGVVTIKSRAVDDSGNLESAGVGINVTVAVPVGCTGNTIWPNTATPALAAVTDNQSIEVGVKFQSNVAGSICGIRFYKGSANTGTHVGSLWDSAGNKLVQATFTGESASGWQQVNLATPASISANTTYVASYHSSSYFGITAGTFAGGGVVNGPLNALSAATSGGNGVYSYSATSTFPSIGSGLGNNYWVDVVFNAKLAPTLSSISVTPASPVIAIGNTPLQFTATGTYSDGTTNNLTGQVTWTSTTTSVATIASSGVATAMSAGTSTISATLNGITGSTVLTINTAPLAIGTTSLPNGLVGTAYTASLVANGGTLPYTWSLANGTLPGGLNLNTTTGVISGTPSAVGTSNFTIQLSDSTNPAVPPTKPLSITVGAGVSCATGNTIWPATAIPTSAAVTDNQAIEVGVKFQTSVAGTICGIRFYKGNANTGTHVGSLWNNAGQVLAQVTFTGESASGWQQMNFATPVPISANSTYVASYHSSGYFGITAGTFAGGGVVNGPLNALSAAASGGNGVYRYSAASTFPSTGSSSGNNYWVDVVFN